MTSLIHRIKKLEIFIGNRVTPDKMNEAAIICRLMDECTSPGPPGPGTDSTTRDEAIRRLKQRMASADPEDPQPPSLQDETIANLLDVDLTEYAVNEKHRQVIIEARLGE